MEGAGRVVSPSGSTFELSGKAWTMQGDVTGSAKAIPPRHSLFDDLFSLHLPLSLTQNLPLFTANKPHCFLHDIPLATHRRLSIIRPRLEIRLSCNVNAKKEYQKIAMP